MAVEAANDKKRALLAFYLVALAIFVNKKVPGANLKALAKSMFDQAGRPSNSKELMDSIAAGKILEEWDVPREGLDGQQLKLARAIENVEKVGDKWYQEVSRLAGQVVDPKIAAIWKPDLSKPSGIKDPKERDKAMNRYLKDVLLTLKSDGSKLPEILKRLDKESGTNDFSKILPSDILKDTTVDSNGLLSYNGEPLVSRGGGAVSLWVLRGAKIGLPQRSRGDDSYVFAYIPARGETPQKVYKLSSVQKANDKKWKVVQSLIQGLNKVRTAWMGLLKRGDALGAVIHFSYLTACRIGTVGNETDGKATQGATTLTIGNVTLKGQKVIVRYPGKKGVEQVHVLEPNPETKELIKWIQNRIKSGAKSHILFTDDGDVIANSTINNFLKSQLKGVTIHKFRHLRGTTLALEVLAKTKVPPNVSQSEGNRIFKQAMEQVGHALGHYNLRGTEAKVTAATSIKNYVVPAVMINWFKEHKLEIPSFIPKK